jgi:hypothetical protein
LLKLLADALLFLALVDLPALSLLLDFKLVLLDDLLLLELEVAVNFFDRTGKVLFEELTLLLKVLVNLRFDQGVLMFRKEGVRAST